MFEPPPTGFFGFSYAGTESSFSESSSPGVFFIVCTPSLVNETTRSSLGVVISEPLIFYSQTWMLSCFFSNSFSISFITSRMLAPVALTPLLSMPESLPVGDKSVDFYLSHSSSMLYECYFSNNDL